MAVAREDDTGQVEPTKGEIDARVDQPTDSDIQDGDVEHNERDRETDDEESLSRRGAVEPDKEQVPDSSETQEGITTEQDTGGSTTAPEQVEPKKKVAHTALSEESKREAEYQAKEESDEFVQGKTEWKSTHPDQTLKRYKNLYIKGVIDTLPWERPQSVDNSEGYQQNAEQNESSIFNRIKRVEQDQDNNKS